MSNQSKPFWPLCALLVALCFAPALAFSEDIAIVNNPNPADKLFLRQDMSTDKAPLGLYYNGTPVQVLDGSDPTWTKVSIGPLTGYMMKAYLAFGDGGAEVTPMFPIVTIHGQDGTNRANLYALPDGASPLIASLPNGAAATVWGVDPQFIHVETEGFSGFMAVSDLTSVDEAAAHTLAYGALGDRFHNRIEPPPEGFASVHVTTNEDVPLHAGLAPFTLSLYGSEDAEGVNWLDLALIQREGETQSIPLDIQGYSQWFSYGEYFLTFEDMNFDGYTDILINRSPGANNEFYDIYTFDAQRGLFFFNRAFSQLEAYPIVSPADDTIHCFTKDGAAVHETFDYVVLDGLPLLVAKVRTEYISETRARITRWQRVDGKLTEMGQRVEDVIIE